MRQASGSDTGFDDYLSKLDRAAMLRSIEKLAFALDEKLAFALDGAGRDVEALANGRS